LLWFRSLFSPDSLWNLRLAAWRAGGKLNHVSGAPNGKKLGSITAVVPFYGDSAILEWFLSYHLRLGVIFFVFLDLSADQTLAPLLLKRKDCAVWTVKKNFVPADADNALNFLRHKYARDRWCLSIEPCDFLVFPHSETRHIRDLTDFLDNEQRSSVFAIIVDAYADQPVDEADGLEDVSPFVRLPFFDQFGYQTLDENTGTIVGGVRRRALCAETPNTAPPLNRVPLVKLKSDCYYLTSTRRLIPAHLNKAHTDWHSSPTACLMRYALISSEMAMHTAKLVKANQMPGEISSPLPQGSAALASLHLKTQGSGRFESSRDLLNCGLLNNGQWF